MDFHNTLNLYRNKINEELKNYFKNISTSEYRQTGKEIIEDIKEFTLRGGKRVRAILVIFGYKAYGGKNIDEILKVAIAVELMQSFLLVHDDIIDRDEKRRGRTTLHKLYEKRYSGITNNPEKLGNDLAIIAGDIASVMGQEIIQEASFDDSIKLKAIKIFNRAIIRTCVGQALDVISTHKEDSSEEEIEAIHRLKTSTYTFQAPLMLGAVFSGAKDDKIEALKKFASPLGKAFQIKDDIIGVFGDEEKIGKPIGSDIREGKKTLLISKAITHANKEEREFIKKILRKPINTQQEILSVKRIIEETGSLDYSKKKLMS
ncbi:MAG: polyprenyl synthetase family protein [Nanoarchaeota archaeon]